MAQLNLLPDVKLEYIRAERRKRMVVGFAFLISATFLAIFIMLLLFVRIGQKQHMHAVDADIDKAVAELKSNPDLDKVLTVQNQLNSLPDLHNKKAISSRMFDYLNKMTPTKATVSDVIVDFDAGTINIKGNADSLSTVNKFADTLKFTEYKVEGENPAQGNAFKEVVLKSFSVSDSGEGKGKVTYELEMKFDPAIFANSAPSNDGKSPVTLTVPDIISTRSATQTPENLFAPQPKEEQ